MKRRYFNPWTTPWGMSVCSPDCEHCDGEHYEGKPLVRYDRLRGWVCPSCDSSLDEMMSERA